LGELDNYLRIVIIIEKGPEELSGKAGEFRRQKFGVRIPGKAPAFLSAYP
jgi:hypothetical protein